MKKIDLTYAMRRASRKTMPAEQAEILAKFKTSNPFFAGLNNFDTLKKEVLKALANYCGGTIEEAEEMFNLAEYLRDNPTCEISNAKFALVEKAIGNASVEVKATWKSMVESLNAA